MSRQCIVNHNIVIPFLSYGLVPGKTSFSVVMLKDGVVLTALPTITYFELGSGAYTLAFTPLSTGSYDILIENNILLLEVVSKTLASVLQNLEDEALGSWTWDKTSGSLLVLRQDGSTLAPYQVVDNVQTASREKLN